MQLGHFEREKEMHIRTHQAALQEDTTRCPIRQQNWFKSAGKKKKKKKTYLLELSLSHNAHSNLIHETDVRINQRVKCLRNQKQKKKGKRKGQCPLMAHKLAVQQRQQSRDEELSVSV